MMYDTMPSRDDLDAWRAMAIAMVSAEGPADPDLIAAIISSATMEQIMVLSSVRAKKRRRRPHAEQLQFDFETPAETTEVEPVRAGPAQEPNVEEAAAFSEAGFSPREEGDTIHWGPGRMKHHAPEIPASLRPKLSRRALMDCRSRSPPVAA